MFFWKLTWQRRYRFKSGYQHLDIGWNEIVVSGKIIVPIDQIRARIRTEEGIILSPIEDTPHFKWIYSLIMDNKNVEGKEEYIQYLEKYEPNWIVDERLKKVVSMIGWVKSKGDCDQADCDVVLVQPRFVLGRKTHFEIYDGVHRTSIMRALCYSKIIAHVLG
jgi:hypothetical protein